MKKNVASFLLIGLFFLPTSCVKHEIDTAIQHGAKKLSGKQISTLVNGSSVQMDGSSQSAMVEFLQDGSLSGKNTSGEKDKGEWKVKGDDLCLFFKKWGQGDITCYQLVQDGSEFKLYNRKGMFFYTLTVMTPGEKDSSSEILSKPATSSQLSAPVQSPRAEERSPAIVPVSPQAAADVTFFIRQSAQNCPGCNLAHVDLSGQTLIGANLQGANLTEANLSHANLRRANLRGANLYRADLRQADLAGADLTGANLSESLRE
ncbi:MAG: pentapeptide repeat-containing protein [Desulfobulbaceae bacterium]|nr:pentapeptide repeat-containing protein [Desulfobulbaceae bacterium]